jgi:alpha-tubulin suppressor-like RCC1 family protein
VVFLSKSGEVFCAGDGAFAQVGQGEINKHGAFSDPRIVNGSLQGKRVVDIQTGFDHTVALTAEGEIHCWGQNEYRQCSAEAVDVVPIPSHFQSSVLARQIVAGHDCSGLISEEGQAMIWGEPGDGSKIQLQHLLDLPGKARQLQVRGLGVGNEEVVIVDENDQSWRKGKEEEWFQLGEQRVDSATVNLGTGFGTMLSQSESNVLVFGNSEEGRLGDGRNQPDDPMELPFVPPLFIDRKCKLLASGPTHSIAVMKS